MGLGWSVASQRKAARWGQGSISGIPFYWAVEVQQDSEYSDIWLHSGRQQLRYTISLCLAWQLEAGPGPATHFSNLSTSLCCYYCYCLTQTHQRFRPVVHVNGCIFHYKCPWQPDRFKLGQKLCLSYSQPCLQGLE